MENNNLENQNVVENNNNQNQEIKIDYDKLADIINKGKETKENSILKSFFEQNGLKEDEVKQAIANYKENTKKQEEAQKNKGAELETKLADVQKELKNEKFNNAIKEIGYELGLDSKSVKAISKLAEINIDEIFDDKNVINSEKIKEAFNQVLEEYPQFKKEEKIEGLVFGAPDGKQKNDDNPFKFNFNSIR